MFLAIPCTADVLGNTGLLQTSYSEQIWQSSCPANGSVFSSGMNQQILKCTSDKNLGVFSSPPSDCECMRKQTGFSLRFISHRLFSFSLVNFYSITLWFACKGFIQLFDYVNS